MKRRRDVSSNKAGGSVCVDSPGPLAKGGRDGGSTVGAKGFSLATRLGQKAGQDVNRQTG